MPRFVLDLKIFLIFLSISIVHVFNIKPGDFCKPIQQQCKGLMYGYNYNEKCQTINCIGKYSFQCRNDLCSSDKETCDMLTKTNHLINSIKSSSLFDKKMKQFKSFTQSINDCPFIEHDLQLSDICLNGQNCFTTRILKKMNRVCSCFGVHNYHCGTRFCTIHSRACDVQKLLNMTKQIKTCGNDNRKINKNLKLF